jgi:hypothetical protein
MLTRLPILVVLIACGLVGAYGFLRPGPAAGEAPAAVQAKLDALPLNFDGWVGQNADATPELQRTMAIAEAKAYLSRTYKDQKTGDSVAVMLLYGEPGAMGAHTPSVCYRGSGYRECSRETLSQFGNDATLWFGGFEGEKSASDTIAVYWGWGVAGQWFASENPRITFADHALIYKLYVQRSTGGLRMVEEDPLLRNFVNSFLEQFQQNLAAQSGPPSP